MYNGDIRLGSTIDIKFTTTDTAGVPIVLAGTPVVSAYVGNSTVEITAGITLIVDLDTRVGLNNVRVVASGANGFATATDVALVITTGTIGGASAVGYAVGSFSIENRSAVMPATAGRTLVIDAAGLADANAVKLGPTGTGTAQTARDIGASVLLSNGTGAGQVKIVNGYVAMTWADIDAPTTAVALTGTTIATSQVVASVTAPVTSTSNIKQNQALANFEFLMTDATTHAPITGRTVAVTRSIDGGAFVAGTLSAVTEVSAGIYRVDFAAADLNGKVITLRATSATCDDTFERIVTQP